MEIHDDHSLFISPLELQILYKERILKSPKDREDALHLRELFTGHLDEERIKYYNNIIEEYESGREE